MKARHRSFGGWRSLMIALIVSSLLLLASVGSASAQSATVTYDYFAGSGVPCFVTECPDVSSAPNGDTITIAGQGTWTAQQLLSFVSYGTAPPFPPTFEGGKALMSIHLSPSTGGSGFDGVLRITCLIGSPPPSAHEGIRLNVQDVINFNKEVSG